MFREILKNNYKQAIFVGVIIAFAFWLSKVVIENDTVQGLVNTYGYVGIFIVSAISGFNIVVPIPAITFFPVFLASGLDFWYVILTISFGMTIGDTMGFFIGRAGKTVLSGHMKNMMARLKKWKKKNSKAPLIFLAIYSTIAPFPNELVVLPLAFMGYRLSRVFPIILAGNIIFNTLVGSGIITIFNSF